MVIYTSKINEKLKNTDDFLLSSENKILNQIDECAKRILPLQDTRPIILISGPSGSSKTTTAIKLAKALRKNGADVCYIPFVIPQYLWINILKTLPMRSVRLKS